MNRQVNYIIYAVLLSLSLPIGYYFVSKIASTEITGQNQSMIIDNGEKDNTIATGKSAFIGKGLFNSKCAACHQIFKHSTGPALMSLEERGSWGDRSELYKWIKNPAAYMKTNKYTKDLKGAYGSMMQSFPRYYK
ncbi:MAG: c-type cytochrome [Bacteroidota bacterium]